MTAAGRTSTSNSSCGQNEPRTISGTVLFSFCLSGILAVVGSVLYGYYQLGEEYATSPADKWLLVGGVTSSSASFRVRLSNSNGGGVDNQNGNNNSHKLVISKDGSSLDNPVSEHSLVLVTAGDGESDNDATTAAADYGLYTTTVTGLEPQTVYYYGVQSSSSSSTTSLQGSFQTPAPEGTAFNFSIATAGCAWTGSKSAVFDVIRQDHPGLQLFLHLGDFHYQDIDSNDMTERLDAVSTVLQSQPQSNLYRALPLVYIWDDHDYLGNNDPDTTDTKAARETALTSYQMAFPHYPLAVAAAASISSETETTTNTVAATKPPSSSPNSNNNDIITPIPVYHAFTIGTVRFIITDLQSESTATSIYSEQQRDWLFQELQQAAQDDQYDFVIWVTSKTWIGMPTNDKSNEDDELYGSWFGNDYSTNRSDLSTHITNVFGGEDGPQNLLVLGGDAHMVAFDDGTNTYFGGDGETNDDNSTTVYSFPILQTAPLDRIGSAKGGPYTEQCLATDFERTHQYSILSFQFPPPPTDDENNDSNNNNNSTTAAAACIDIESFRVDQWKYKEKIFSKQLCGKLFRPAVVAPDVSDSPPSCSIELLTPITVGIGAVALVLAALLGGLTCCAMTQQSHSRQGSSSSCSALFCSMFSVLVAWAFAAVTAYGGVIASFLLSDITQFDLRVSYLFSIALMVFMMFVVMIIKCCCFKGRGAGEEECDKGTRTTANDPETGLDKNSPATSNISSSSSSISRPCVVRQATSSAVDEENLPEGVILTGGAELHKDGLAGQGVRVAVIDSGIDDAHPGFKGKVTKKIWLRSGTPLEEDDHGTHVAGTIHLMAPDAEIYDFRVFGKEGSLGVDEAIAKAIRQATDEGCGIINMSLGGAVPNNVIWEAVLYATKKEVVLVCAAGNEGDNDPLTNEISFPASYKECISVAAVSKEKGFPVAVFSNSNPLVDYAGIGVDVTSFKPGGGYQIMSGTSMACPHVAGLIACLMTSGGNTYKNILQVLNNLAIDIESTGYDNATGVGFVTYLNESAFDELLSRSKG